MTASRMRRSMAVAFLENRAAVLGRRDVVPIEIELQEYLLGVLAVFGGTRRRGRGLVELHWCGDDLIFIALGIVVDDDIPVRSHLRIVQCLLRGGQGRPDARLVRESRTPILQILSCDGCADERSRLVGIG